MKKNTTTRLIVLALFVAIITAVILSGTFAKYTSSDSGNGTGLTVAKWYFDLSNAGTMSRSDTVAATDIASGKLAPGTFGSFNVELDSTDTEVGVDYVVTLGSFTNKPTNLKFYTASSYAANTEVEASSDTYTYRTHVDAGSATMGATVTVYWKWDYETTDGDSDDTTDGQAAETMTFTVTATATQSNPA